MKQNLIKVFKNHQLDSYEECVVVFIHKMKLPFFPKCWMLEKCRLRWGMVVTIQEKERAEAGLLLLVKTL